MGRPLAEKKLKRIDVYVEPALEKALSQAASEDDRTLSNYIARVLDEYVETFLTSRKRKKE
jgi:predicted HicB family RNase H-like nuclease